MNKNQKEELIRFVDFHSRARSFGVNSIQAVTSLNDIGQEMVQIMSFLEKDYVSLKYSSATEPVHFLGSLLLALNAGKTVLIDTETLDFDPMIFDQLIQFKDKNKLSLASEVSISPLSSVFLFYQKGQKNKKIWEIADHVFDVDLIN